MLFIELSFWYEDASLYVFPGIDDDWVDILHLKY